MLRTQSEFVNKIELDHAVNLLYSEVIVALQMNDIAWNEITDGRAIPIDETFLKTAGYAKVLPFKGSYRFSIDKVKSNESGLHSILLLNLIFSFEPNHNKKVESATKPLEYKYKVLIVKNLENNDQEIKE